jgi:predicted nucleic acid-binding protein
MRQQIVLDTDISSLIIKNRLPPAWQDRLVWTRPCMTFVTRGELVSWILVRDLGKQRRSEVRDWIAKNHFLPGDKAGPGGST